eukprot:1699760-Rhodomonas_salina.1
MAERLNEGFPDTQSGFMLQSTGNLHWKIYQAQLDYDIYILLIFLFQGGGGVGARYAAEIRAMVSGVRGRYSASRRQR